MLGMMAFMAMNAVLALYLAHRFQFTETNVGYVYSLVGAASLVMRSLALGPAVGWFGEVGALRLGLISLAGGYLLQGVAPTVPLFLVGLLAVPVGTALLFPATTSLASQLVDSEELGVTMGVQQALGGLARLVGPLWAGASFELVGPASPFYLASVLVLLTLWTLAPARESKFLGSKTRPQGDGTF
jgi:predicted MFS family arabinose efflux permease